MLKIEDLDPRMTENKRYLGNNIFFCPRIQSELRFNDEGGVEYIEYKGVDIDVLNKYTKNPKVFNLRFNKEELSSLLNYDNFLEELRKLHEEVSKRIPKLISQIRKNAKDELIRQIVEEEYKEELRIKLRNGEIQ